MPMRLSQSSAAWAVKLSIEGLNAPSHELIAASLCKTFYILLCVPRRVVMMVPAATTPEATPKQKDTTGIIVGTFLRNDYRRALLKRDPALQRDR